MITRIGSTTGVTIRGDIPGDPFEVAATPAQYDAVPEAFGEEYEASDCVLRDRTSPVVHHIHQITGAPPSASFTPPLIDGKTSFDSGSLIRVVARHNGQGRCTPWLSQNTSGGETNPQFISWLPGSLGECLASIADRSIGKDEQSKLLFQSQNHTTATYVRNSTGWWGDVDVSAMSVKVASGLNVTLISPRVVIRANHVGAGLGQVWFATTANATVSANVIANGVAFGDIELGILDEVPAGITPMKIPPLSLFSSLLLHPQYAPILSMHSTGSTAAPCLAIRPCSVDLPNATITSGSPLSPWESFYEDVSDGDSGRLLFFPGYALGHWVTNGIATLWPAHIAAINAKIEELAPGQGLQVTPEMPTGFTDWSA
jgi:hypothetical protein